MTFPAGTDISGANIIERLGIGHGTLTKAGTTVTLNVQNAVSVPGGTYIRLEMVNVKNPQFPFPNYQVTVTTRNPANGIIDGPTQSTAYNIKQIGRDDIAGSAITGPKIADNTITSTKPAESFMKRVSLLDDGLGNARGWNPNGMIDFFQISEPEVSGPSGDAIFFNIEVRTPGTSAMTTKGRETTAHNALTNTFNIRCFNPPPIGAELHYVIGKLPPHINS